MQKETREEYVATTDELRQRIADDKVIVVDVRNGDELSENVIKAKRWLNIPVPEIGTALNMSDDAFKTKYGMAKPGPSGEEFVFNCGMGNRSTKALHAALELGYENAKHFLGGQKKWAAENPELYKN